MNDPNLSVGSDQVLVFSITGKDLAGIMLGLEEIQHKVAKPIELKLMAQLAEQLKVDG